MPRLKSFDVTEMKERLGRAFRAMRKAGLLARQNFECCSSCAGYAISQRAEDLISSGKKKKEDIKGCCFYHAQDNDDLVMGNAFYLAYGPMGTQKYDTVGLPNEQVAEIIIKCLKDEGIEIEWDGSGDTRIFVLGFLN